MAGWGVAGDLADGGKGSCDGSETCGYWQWALLTTADDLANVISNRQNASYAHTHNFASISETFARHSDHCGPLDVLSRRFLKYNCSLTYARV